MLLIVLSICQNGTASCKYHPLFVICLRVHGVVIGGDELHVSMSIRICLFPLLLMIVWNERVVNGSRLALKMEKNHPRRYPSSRCLLNPTLVRAPVMISYLTA
ncbi:hypothetical protein EDD15DRAFT_1509185 [Pisolithus albus]|nr:hypothetical protein EDD15DRAFT_1509185 [Pisolithus albus]